MVLLVNFTKLFGLHSKLFCYYPIKKRFQSGELSISEKQTFIKLFKRKDRNKRLIKNWRLISLLNIHLFLRFQHKEYKKYLPSLISSDQPVYPGKRFISQRGRLIFEILEIADLLKISGLLLTAYIEKAFNSVDHQFLINVLKTFRLEKKQ